MKAGYYMAFFALGAILGSFFNMLIYRLPRNISIVAPRSFCPHCGKQLKWWHNIPIVSYLLLGGKCYYCKSPIGVRYLLVEIITALTLVLLYAKFGLTEKMLWASLFLLPLIPAAFIDLEHYILPDSATIGTLVWGLISSVGHISPVSIKASVIGALVCGGAFLAVAFLSKGGMGLGDVKLAASFGANFGLKVGVTSLFVSVLLGALVGIALMLLRKKGRKDRIPFGPFMVLGAYACTFFGKELARLYLGF